MTRSFGTSQKERRPSTLPVRSHRDASITLVGFTCFRLVRIYDCEPGEPPYAPIQLLQSTNTMFAFTKRR